MKRDKIILFTLLLCMAGEIFAISNPQYFSDLLADTKATVKSDTKSAGNGISPEDAMCHLSLNFVYTTQQSELLKQKRATYQQALDLLYMRHFNEARELFLSLGDYKDSALKAKYCITYPESEPIPEKEIVVDTNIYSTYEHGHVYLIGSYGGDKYTGLVYVPNEVSPQTAFVQYYAGGRGESDDYLWRTGVDLYLKAYSPDAIILFTNEPGTGHMHWRNACQYDLLRQVAKECGTIIHDVSALGSSSGAYTAMMLAADFYLNYGIRVKNVCTLDTGCYWNEGYIELSPEEASAIAEAGTVFYLFEETAFCDDLTHEPLRRILDAGIETYAVLCYHGNHSVISQNAYSLGVFSFSIDPKNVVLPTYHYWMKQIDSDTTADDLKGYSWTEKPEDDTRTVF